ncbi:AP2-associated protein kinase 1 isoform X1 [Tanacetum coccineum]
MVTNYRLKARRSVLNQSSSKSDAAITFISPLTSRGSASGGYTEYQSGRRLDNQGQNTSVVHAAVCVKLDMAGSLLRINDNGRGCGGLKLNYLPVSVYACGVRHDSGYSEYMMDSSGVSLKPESPPYMGVDDRKHFFFAMHCQSPPIAHRDLTAENLLLGSDGLWKLFPYIIYCEQGKGSKYINQVTFGISVVVSVCSLNLFFVFWPTDPPKLSSVM